MSTYSWCEAYKLDNCTVWRGTHWQWSFMTTGGILFILAVVAANLLNLLAFHGWRAKSPYILFHVSLATSSIVSSVFASISPISRSINWGIPSTLSFKISTAAFIIQFTSTVNDAFISIDRWLSVQYAVNGIRRPSVIVVTVGADTDFIAIAHTTHHAPC
ncbi:hypothetical protein BV898_02354 [Hypsibius exemplaris]|uniref:G-protein coupled receptors family 1 profile domain-containing protein n=1 Tax=Hypsibius exemplaris TaxID=2072580 RepID=A0A1W0X7V1_HYPEX|nr:hypothetical protein BV898_02354 [Hypsibius exemplaris]